MPSEKDTPRENESSSEHTIVPRTSHDIFHAFDAMWEAFRRDFLQPWRPWGYWDRDPRLWGMLTRRKACADLVDTGTAYQVCVEVPGIPKENLDVTVTKHDIEISGQAEAERDRDDTGFVVKERGYTEIYRKMAFPDAVRPEYAEATVTDGLLNITIPKDTVPPDDAKHKVEIT